MGYTRVGSSLACKYWTKVKVTDNDKRFNLLWYGINYKTKKF